MESGKIKELFGLAEISSKQDLRAGSLDSWTIRYTAGLHGIDDSGKIILVRRTADDSSIPQFDNPEEIGYVEVYTDGNAKLKISYEEYYVRPNKSAIVIKVIDGYLKRGDKIFIALGGRDSHSPGFRIQSFPEKNHEFKILVDAYGTGKFKEIASPCLNVVPGYLDSFEIIATPSFIETGEEFSVNVRALDSSGNSIYSGLEGKKIEVISPDIFGLNSKIFRFSEDDKGIKKIKGLILTKSGTYYFKIKVDNNTYLSNPVICSEESRDNLLYWGDLHGQTETTVGTGSVQEYFNFARERALLDFCSWQGNDFQVTKENWLEVQGEVRKNHNPDKFITFLGYEWSGTSGGGGDHNIYYLNDDEPIYRSSHALIEDETDLDSDRYPISDLWEEFGKREDVMAVPHVGGRYANLDYYNPDFIHLVEIHSHHGTFEWIAREALERGYKVGIIAGSDDHTGRPGLSFPTNQLREDFVSFDVRGGLTAVLAPQLTRETLWQSLIKRRCYGTTGKRIVLDISSDNYKMGQEYSTATPPKLKVKVRGTSPVQEVEVRRKNECLFNYPVTNYYQEAEQLTGRTRKRIKLEWSGLRIKGRRKKQDWSGMLHIKNGRILTAEEFAFDRRDEGITKISNQIIQWNSSTSGDIDGIIMEIEMDNTTVLEFHSKNVNFKCPLFKVMDKPQKYEAEGLNSSVRLVKLKQESDYRKEIDFTYTDKNIRQGLNPYWIRVLQSDGHMAWSSPIFVNYQV